MKIDDKQYVVIHGWMRNQLNLTGNDLMVYAIIYGFSQLENHRFTGSLQYLADWCGATKQGIQKNLKNLLDAGLIEKEITTTNGVYNSVAYYTTQLYDHATQLHRGIQLSCINNIAIDNIDDKIEKKEDISKDISKKKFSLNHSHAQKETKAVDEVFNLYLTVCTNLPKIRALTDSRKKSVLNLLNKQGITKIKEAFEIANATPFLTGDNDRGWKADFDFLMREDKFVAVLEGKYNSKKKSNRKHFGEDDDEKFGYSSKEKLHGRKSY